jgi:AhpD family alkylhydroperoxidase
MQQVRCPTGQEQNVSCSHRQALAIRKFDSAFSCQDNVIGRFSQGFLLVIECPISLKLTPQIHAAPHIGQTDEFIDRIHLSASHKNLSGLDKPESRPRERLSLSKQYTNLLRSHAMFNNWSELLPTIQKAFGALGKSNPKMVKAYMALGEASAENDVLDAKTRELISIAVAVTTRCDGCIAVHADAAIKAGASREEVAATLASAISLNAGAAYIYSLRTLEAYDSLRK